MRDFYSHRPDEYTHHYKHTSGKYEHAYRYAYPRIHQDKDAHQDHTFQDPYKNGDDAS